MIAKKDKPKNCLTRDLVADGHNIREDGAPHSSGMCGPCNEICCGYIGPACGCAADNCTDKGSTK